MNWFRLLKIAFEEGGWVTPDGQYILAPNGHTQALREFFTKMKTGPKPKNTPEDEFNLKPYAFNTLGWARINTYNPENPGIEYHKTLTAAQQSKIMDVLKQLGVQMSTVLVVDSPAYSGLTRFYQLGQLFNGKQAVAQKKVAMPLPPATGYPKDKGYSALYTGDNTMEQGVADQFSQEHGPLSYKGHGADGIVYKNNEPGKVWKVTASPDEAAVVQKVKGKNIPCIPQIYQVKQIQKRPPTPNKANFPGSISWWAVQMEEVSPLPENERFTVNFLYQFYQRNHNLPEASSMPTADREVYQKYAQLIECLKANGLQPDDSSAKNIGVRNGAYVLFDLGLTIPLDEVLGTLGKDEMNAYMGWSNE